jgi:oxalate decarboxylase
VRIADSRNSTVSTTVAAALVTVHPGGMREMHWHPNADEWQYWIKGKGQMTIFNTGPNAITMDFNAGDIGYVKKNLAAISRTPATPTCNSSKCSEAPISPTSRCPTG